jgi:hypothetical protein
MRAIPWRCNLSRQEGMRLANHNEHKNHLIFNNFFVFLVYLVVR